MKTITTKFLGPTNYRGARIVATDGDFRVTVPYAYECDTEPAHWRAVQALVSKHWRTGPVSFLVGHQKNALVWVVDNCEYVQWKHPGTE